MRRSPTRSVAWLGAVLALASGPAHAQAQWWDGHERTELEGGRNPVRPFLLVDAPRRFLPTETASVAVQLRSTEGGRVEVAVYRIHDPAAWLGAARAPRQGVSIASTAYGREAEQLLLHRRGALPRSGARLTLLSTARVPIAPPSQRPRRVARPNESLVYDSNEIEQEDVATWGVVSEEWSATEVPLGPVATGLYLVRVHAGSWSTTALVSVGELVLLARRGDGHDTVLVTDADGTPLAGVSVDALAEEAPPVHATTGADGRVRLPARQDSAIRWVARRGADHAWADVAHARLEPCDPRVYLATGRPLHRRGEVVHVRGHVRGCDAGGRYVPLANEAITLAPAEGGEVEVRTDTRGDFVAELVAEDGGLRATVRGHPQWRELRIDDRALPRSSISVEADRAFARPGEILTLTLADEHGGWPVWREAWLESSGGRLVAQIGPRSPAVFHVVVPETREPVERLTLTAGVVDGFTISMAATDVWTGRAPLLVELATERERASTDEMIEVEVRTRRLDAGMTPQRASLAVHGTDGNVRKSGVRWEGRVVLDADGTGRLRVPARGIGPWIVEASVGEARGEVVLWERERPPALAERGELAVALATSHVDPGAPLRAHVRLPAGPGRAWVTLEQGSVWSDALVAAGGPVQLAVPEQASGMASVVVTHVARGRVRTASTTVEVTTSRPLTLSVQADRLSYDEGGRARVSIQARGSDGAPADAVATLWMADAGYWDLGEDDYPLPGPYLRRTGRMGSPGDSTRPAGFGAEEGRVLGEAELAWNGRVLEHATFRHAWDWSGEIVQVTERGSLAAVATALARSAGLRSAYVCPETAQLHPRVSLRAVDLPWDLVAARVGHEIGVWVHVGEGAELRFECPGEGMGGAGGFGAGRGAAVPQIRAGSAGVMTTREQRLEGTLRFIGLLPLGPDGREEVMLDLPAHPGRWRVEVLAIAADGGGDREHAVLQTRRPLEIWTEVPRWMRLGDEVQGSIVVVAPSRAGRRVPLEVEMPGGLQLLSSPIPADLALDARGRGEIEVRLRARSVGPHELRVAAGDTGVRDAVHARVDVAGRATDQPLAMRTLVGPGATDVHVPLPQLAADGEVTIAWNADLADAVAEVLEEVREPRWNVPALRIDRLQSLSALAEALGGATDLRAIEARQRIDAAIVSEAAALADTTASDEALSWWRGLPSSPRLTAEALVALGPAARGAEWQGAWSRLDQASQDPALGPADAALVARALAVRSRDPQRIALLLQRVVTSGIDDVAPLTAAVEATLLADLDDAALKQSLVARLEASIRARLDQGRPGRSTCAGPAWFLCFAQRGERGSLARAAVVLLRARPGQRGEGRALGLRVAEWISSGPPVDRGWIWGTEEPDRLALFAALRAGGRAPSYQVLVDGRPVAAPGGRVRVPVRARAVIVRFASAPDRIGWLRVDGLLRAEPPRSTAGTVQIARRFARDATGAWTLELELRPRERARGADLRVPMPAGLTVRPGARPDGVRISTSRGELRVSFGTIEAAPRTLRIPLVRVSGGRFEAGSALLRTADRDVWAVAPPVAVSVGD